MLDSPYDYALRGPVGEDRRVTSLPAFAATAFLLAMLPGPGQAVMTRQVLDHGRRPPC